MRGKYYDVKLSEPLCDVPGCSMPTVEKDLLYRYFYADTHSGRAYPRSWIVFIIVCVLII